ncbi:single-stranded DNA-binding protein [Candidatus Falkowbacteria bacterium]|nr:single-stranded DNA-binding protein [Candidatus Falkowbacteria bacterium]MBT7007431.1 single-stranded DNA-binding protein [Candidatus Falkowbacteria bacterium]
MDLNKAMIIGRLTRDPEVRTTPQGTSVASFSLATNFVWTDSSGQKQEKVEYHNIVVWRKLADICGQYLKKGSKIYIEGRLQTRDWEGQDGVKRYRTEVVADNMIMLDSKGAGSAGPSSNQFQPAAEPPIIQTEEPVAPAGTAIPEADNSAPADNSSDDEIKVENIPF